MSKRVPITFKIEQGILDRLHAVCEQQGVFRNDLANMLLDAGLTPLETANGWRTLDQQSSTALAETVTPPAPPAQGADVHILHPAPAPSVPNDPVIEVGEDRAKLLHDSISAAIRTGAADAVALQQAQDLARALTEQTERETGEEAGQQHWHQYVEILGSRFERDGELYCTKLCDECHTATVMRVS